MVGLLLSANPQKETITRDLLKSKRPFNALKIMLDLSCITRKTKKNLFERLKNYVSHPYQVYCAVQSFKTWNVV